MKFLLTLVSGFFLMNLQAQNGFKVKVKLTDLKDGKVVLSYTPPGETYKIDTNFVIENGWMVFSGSVPEPLTGNLFVRRDDINIKMDRGIMPAPPLTLILTNDIITVEGRADKVYMASVKGGKINDEWAPLKKREGELTDMEWSGRKKAALDPEVAKDTSYPRRMRELSQKISKERETLHKNFIKSHPSSFVSVYLLQNMMNSLSLSELETLYNSLSTTNKSNKPGENISGKIKGLKLTAAGQPAIPFFAKDIDGKDFSLGSLKGKYVILDFWGSWCGPCRQSHPHLKELYTKYKNDGLEIVGVAYEYGSIEQAKKDWKKAIEEDGIPWIHVLNNEAAEKNDIVKNYGVSAFPTKFIIDKDGKILAKYIGSGGTDFDNKLKEIFGK